MCGIAGVIYSSSITVNKAEALIRDMNRALGHRGPDASGYYFDHQHNVVLGHTRLAIIDLSSLGHQPMHSYCGRYSITFNGEIYNHKDIKEELVKAGFSGEMNSTTDTEVLINAISFWGIEKTIRKLVGMFAFCVLDKSNGLVTLVRDRAGEKPLYWTRTEQGLFFASEIKALQAATKSKLTVCNRAIKLFLGHGYVPAPLSIFSKIYKLRPAEILTFSKNEVSTNVFWSPGQAEIPSAVVGKTLSETELSKLVFEQIQKSIEEQMDVDVPFGALLSGGLDSSTVVALMTGISSKPIETFSIGFEDEVADESIFARRVAERLKSNHHELMVSSDDFFHEIANLPRIYDEPFADPSQLPTVILAKFARQKVKVALTGDGGDETFLGYRRYEKAKRLWHLKTKCPSAFSTLVETISTNLQLLANRYDGLVSQQNLVRLSKIKWLCRCKNIREFYAVYNSFWVDDNVILALQEHTNRELEPGLAECQPAEDLSETCVQFANIDFGAYLPDCLMVKTDRASMNVGLELRSPLLDHRLLELYRAANDQVALNMPAKKVLRQILSEFLPQDLINRPKMGFAPPIGRWLQEPLNEWSHQIIGRSVLIENGVIDKQNVVKKFHELGGGDYSSQYQIWNLLMFENWALKNNVSLQ